MKKLLSNWFVYVKKHSIQLLLVKISSNINFISKSFVLIVGRLSISVIKTLIFRHNKILHDIYKYLIIVLFIVKFIFITLRIAYINDK